MYEVTIEASQITFEAIESHKEKFILSEA